MKQLKKIGYVLCMGIAVMCLLGFLATSVLAEEAHSGNGNVIEVPQDPLKNPRLQGKTPSPEWGTSSSIIAQVHAFQFVPIDSTMTWSWTSGASGLMRYKTNVGSPYWFVGSVNLPAGALIQGIELYGCDDNPNTDTAGDIYVWFVVDDTDYGGNVTNGQPGCSWFYYDLSSANITVNKFLNNYAIEVRLSTNDSTNRFQAVNVYYSLQISPPPATPTFSDVPTTHPFFQQIEALAASGITTGYSDGTFRPNNYVTRQALAAYLAKALGLHWPH